jgi:hypothetical protein
MKNTDNASVVTLKNNKIVRETQKWSLNRVKTSLQLVRIDEYFQSPARWTDIQMRDYFDSLFMGMAPSVYILADVSLCLENSVNADDKAYYQKWLDTKTGDKSHVKYLNLDSNNRWTSLTQLFTNNIGLKGGSYFDADGNTIVIKEGARWEDLSPETQNFILSCKITVELYTKATRSQLSDIFIAVNSGSPLNAPEKRNAIISDICKVCRDLGEYYYRNEKTASNLIRKLYKDSQYNRRIVDETFAWFSAIYNYSVNYKITQTTLNDGYDPQSLMSKNAKTFKTNINKFFNEWINPYENELMERKRLGSNTILDLYVFYCAYNDKIKNRDEFIATFLKITDRLVASTICDLPIQNRKYTFAELLRSREYKFSQLRHKVYIDELKGRNLFTTKLKSVEDVISVNDIGDIDEVEVVNDTESELV